jgi:hypothetical protein
MVVSVLHQEERTNSSRSRSGWRSALILFRDRTTGSTGSTLRRGRPPHRGLGRAGAARRMNQLSQCPSKELRCGGRAKIRREHHRHGQALYGLKRSGARPLTTRSMSQQSLVLATLTTHRLIPCRQAFPVIANHPGDRVSQVRSRVCLVLLDRVLTGNRRKSQV